MGSTNTVSNINEHGCLNPTKPRKLWNKTLLRYNYNACCSNLCEKAQSGANDGLMLYCNLWKSITYCCNASTVDFECNIFVWLHF